MQTIRYPIQTEVGYGRNHPTSSFVNAHAHASSFVPSATCARAQPIQQICGSLAPSSTAHPAPTIQHMHPAVAGSSGVCRVVAPSRNPNPPQAPAGAPLQPAVAVSAHRHTGGCATKHGPSAPVPAGVVTHSAGLSFMQNGAPYIAGTFVSATSTQTAVAVELQGAVAHPNAANFHHGPQRQHATQTTMQKATAASDARVPVPQTEPSSPPTALQGAQSSAYAKTTFLGSQPAGAEEHTTNKGPQPPCSVHSPSQPSVIRNCSMSDDALLADGACRACTLQDSPPTDTLTDTDSMLFPKGAQVEALYEGSWYLGTVMGLPEEDPYGLGRFAVQCDDDEEGVYSFVVHLRQRTDNEETSPGTTQSEFQEQSADHAGTGAEGEKTASPTAVSHVPSRDAMQQVVEDPVISKATSSSGEEFIIVGDSDGNQLGTFGKQHIGFELKATAQQLKDWIIAMETCLLPGLLTLLGGEVTLRGGKLKAAEQQRDELRGSEDYGFFGLDSDSSDKDIDRAYRKMSTVLHPDKGGNDDAFADMRKRYEQLKSLRQDASETTGGGGSIQWDHNDRGSMVKAHEDLHLQLVWISKQLTATEETVSELERKKRLKHCLVDGTLDDA